MTEDDEIVLLSDSKAPIWYGILNGKYDNDFEIGSANIDRAKEMARKISDEAYIAVVYNTNPPVCVGTIPRNKF